MNGCTQILDEIVQEHCMGLPWQPLGAVEFKEPKLKLKVTWVFVFYGVHDAAAIRGQYLVLSKAW